eukprot:m.157061 g.157061  ORF g.157061 m.157061 type:complete len:218 (+) comp14453_c0_seq6:65-718(+)
MIDDMVQLTPELAACLVLAFLGSVAYMRYSWTSERVKLKKAADELQAHRVSLADERAKKENLQRLLAAARAGDTTEIARAMDLNADVDSVDPLTKASALYVAAQQGNMGAVAMILARGADKSLKNRHGVTPLIAAVKSTQFTPKCRECAMTLLSNGADPNDEDDVGDTALLAACRIGDIDYIDVLLNNGADAGHTNHKDEVCCCSSSTRLHTRWFYS